MSSNASVRTALSAGLAVLACTDVSAASRRSWPEPKYPVRIEEDVMVKMRDGIRLATDLYMPVGAGARVVLI